MATQEKELRSAGKPRTEALNERLEAVGWALFLILVGLMWLLPAEQEPRGAWLLGIGGIMLGMNTVRYLNGVPISGFTTILGIGGLLGGTGELLGADLEFIPVVLIFFGAGIILRPLFEAKAADQS